jgi:hypothetical protein
MIYSDLTYVLAVLIKKTIQSERLIRTDVHTLIDLHGIFF